MTLTRSTVPLPGWGVLSAWVATRALMLLAWALFEGEATGDVLYYHRRIGGLAEAGLAGTLIEYPTPVVWVLSLPWGLGAGTQAGYLAVFVAMMLALDAWLTVLLHRSGTSPAAVLFWVAFVPVLGPLTVLRFDMVPAVLAGVALLWAARRPAVAGGLVALGAAIKLWPALLLPALLGDRTRRGRTTVGFLVVGVGLALVSLLAGGWTRLLSPLTWQSGRGLQIESVWATPVMVWHALAPELHSVGMSRYQAFEVFGPGVGLWTTVASVSTVLGLVVVAVLAVRAWRSGGTEPLQAAAVMAAVVAVTILTNKTLSPQYVLWLGGPVAVLVLRLGASTVPAPVRRAVGVLALATLVLAALTHLIYPVAYGPLVYDPSSPLHPWAVALLAVRNLLVLALTAGAVALAWRLTGRVQPAVRPTVDATA
ncbi:glycosyltransferase 87 family protein [Auraticoccus monumenti]|uniref:DUF2029 domain-containing protein n=1 Tax=Auraticoccus monumenti TaxID=675864 RepID=A0A1G7AVM0_9ACTN|nr:glycosyltransferase 87 family protein [Auraticoccus monumenti]SDE18914.1 Protein of unknown function [Auraticoccus monumenti]